MNWTDDSHIDPAQTGWKIYRGANDNDPFFVPIKKAPDRFFGLPNFFGRHGVVPARDPLPHGVRVVRGDDDQLFVLPRTVPKARRDSLDLFNFIMEDIV